MCSKEVFDLNEPGQISHANFLHAVIVPSYFTEEEQQIKTPFFEEKLITAGSDSCYRFKILEKFPLGQLTELQIDIRLPAGEVKWPPSVKSTPLSRSDISMMHFKVICFMADFMGL